MAIILDRLTIFFLSVQKYPCEYLQTNCFGLTLRGRLKDLQYVQMSTTTAGRSAIFLRKFTFYQKLEINIHRTCACVRACVCLSELIAREIKF